MINGQLISATSTTETIVRVDVSECNVSIDIKTGTRIEEIPVTEIIIFYETVETETESVIRVTKITHLVTSKEFDTVSLHPDFLNDPKSWPDWVPSLVDKHRPAPRHNNPHSRKEVAWH
ncbi:hypothetical protein ABT282_07005 [Streptomyces sp. NPDC000927]|uniref:hypothetical protein n=1 Tax=Streptomyces sp. NPDC000927 TaxID=3154371 RepID=UPI003329ED12